MNNALNFWKTQETDPVRMAKLAKIRAMRGESADTATPSGTPSGSLIVSSSSQEVSQSTSAPELQEDQTRSQGSDSGSVATAPAPETDTPPSELTKLQDEVNKLTADKQELLLQNSSLQQQLQYLQQQSAPSVVIDSNDEQQKELKTDQEIKDFEKMLEEERRSHHLHQQELEAQLVNLKSIEGEQKQENSQLKAQIHELEQQCHKLREQITELTSKNNDLSVQVEELKQRMNHLSEQSGTAAPTTDPEPSVELNEQNKKLLEEIQEERKKAAEALEAERKRIAQEVEEERKKAADDIQKEKEKAAAEIELAKQKVAEQMEEERIRADQQKFAQDIEEEKKKNSSLEVKVKTLEDCMNKLTTEKKDSEDQLLKTTQKYQLLRSTKKELQSKILDLETKVSQANKERSEALLKSDSQNLSQSSDTSDKPPSDEKSELLQKQLDDLQKENQHLESEVSTLKQKIDDLGEQHQKELQNAKAPTDESDPPQAEDIKLLQKLKDELENDKEDLQKQLKDTKKELLEAKRQSSADLSFSGGSGISAHKRQPSSSLLSEVLKKEVPKSIDKSLIISWFDLKLGKRVGSGGFAEVYEGLYLGERVAVKKLISQDSVEGRKQLMDEADLMASLHSGYVVHFYGAVIDPGNMCLVMEFYPRGSLGFILWDKNEKLPWGRRWQIARDAALGMNYLHSRNPPILHRDLKSGNFLVGSDWRVRLTDFGCSTTQETVQDESQFLGGTLVWTAPEVLDGKEYTTKADVYSYAMVLLELATRKQPWYEYEDATQQLLIRRKVGDGHRPTIPSDTPPDFKKLIEMCWPQKAEERPSFPEIIRWLGRKGYLDKSEGGGDPTEKLREDLAALQEELELQKKLNETAERRAHDAEKAMEREKSRRLELEREWNETERKFQEEKLKRMEMDRVRDEKERELQAEKHKRLEADRKREELEKKVKKEKKKIKDLQEEKEEAERRRDELEKRLKREAGRRERYGE